MLKHIPLKMSPLLVAIALSGGASAATISVSTATGTTVGGQPVSSTANITTGTGTVTIDLFNNLTAGQVNDVSQNLSDFSFTLSGTFATGLVTDTNRTYTGTLINVGTGGAVTATTSTFNGWDFSNTGSTFVLEDLGSTAGPEQTIIGGTAGSSTAYTSANGSIVNNAPHNPFIQGVAHFTLNIAGVTSATTVTAATFSYGTTLGAAGTTIPGNFAPTVPEPISSLLVGTGLVSLFFLRRRIRS